MLKVENGKNIKELETIKGCFEEVLCYNYFDYKIYNHLGTLNVAQKLV